MTLATQITVARIALTPVFAVLALLYAPGMEWCRWAALAVFSIASLSDGVDGYIARAWNQRSKLGALLDPLADKILLNIAFIFLAVNANFAYPIPKWLTILVLSRDLVISLGCFYIHEYYGALKRQPRILGKVTTVCQMAVVFAVLLEWRIAVPLLTATAVLTVLSFFDYIYVGVRQVAHREAANNE